MNWQILADRLECHDISENRLLSIPGPESDLSQGLVTYTSTENFKLDSKISINSLVAFNFSFEDLPTSLLEKTVKFIGFYVLDLK